MESLRCRRAAPGEPTRTLQAGKVWVLHRSWALPPAAAGSGCRSRGFARKTQQKSPGWRPEAAWAGAGGLGQAPHGLDPSRSAAGSTARGSTRPLGGLQSRGASGTLQAPRCPRRAAFVAEFIGVVFSALEGVEQRVKNVSRPGENCYSSRAIGAHRNDSRALQGLL